MTTIKAVTEALLDDLNELFCTNKFAEKCWCMWHIISVKAFHAGGAEQNRAQLTRIAQTEEVPIGILAYQNERPVGWCAVGPRERYARAIKTPSYRHVGPDHLTTVWLVPCFLVHPDSKGLGISRQLLKGAVELAQAHGAEAVDGFPFTNDKRRSSSQIHVGFESTFAACGFKPIRRPSSSRVVMRLEL